MQELPGKMLKQCSVIILLLAFMVMTFSRTIIVVDFYTNQDYIAKNLCENRDKPIMHCGGKCQLRKRLTNQENQEKTNPERRIENRNEALFMEEHSASLSVPFRIEDVLPYSLTSPEATTDRPQSIFHPPSGSPVA